MAISIRMAQGPQDFDAARQMCLAWLDWHWSVYPEDWPQAPDHPMNPERFQATVDQLPDLHARPEGAIFVAYLDAVPVGCVMYHAHSPGVAEFKRMFVAEAGRGRGLGRKLLDAMFDQMRADGYERVVFSSATFLTHARGMYEAAGFTPMPPPDGLPEALRGRVYSMQKSLLPA